MELGEFITNGILVKDSNEVNSSHLTSDSFSFQFNLKLSKDFGNTKVIGVDFWNPHI